MKLAVVGAGYVGLVTGACFAEMGNQVACVEADAARLAQLQGGKAPIHEPGLAPLMQANAAAGRLAFTDDLAEALADAEVAFIAVGTPPQEDGGADVSQVLAVAAQIGDALAEPLVVAGKSTVPVGTADQVRSVIAERLAARGADIPFDVASNPEFLREGSAVNDFMYPDRIVIGAVSQRSLSVLEELYEPFCKKQARIQRVGLRDAEMIKYAANAMLATRISLMNEIALLCDALGVDVEKVRLGLGSDPRIGPAFLYPGCGYGGSCLPKDLRALIRMAEAAGMEGGILEAVERRNQSQQLLLVDKICERFGQDLAGRRFALWGLAFKPNTDDIRSAPALAMARALSERQAQVVAYDPQAMPRAREALAGTGVRFVEDPYEATEGADALLVATDWRQFKQPDFPRLAKQLKGAAIFDGRNLYNPQRCADQGLAYIAIGRTPPTP